MSVLNRTPDNINFLSPQSGFKFVIKRLPTVSFFLQRINVPGITTFAPTTSNPFTKIPHVGDHLDWEGLELTFKVDEALTNYREIHNWLVATTSPIDFSGYNTLANASKQSGASLHSDISLLIMDNSKGTVITTLTFVDCFPVSLSGFILSTDENDIQFVEATASFAYTYYTFG